MVDVILGERGHYLRSFSQSQVAIVGLTDHKVVQLFWWRVMILNLKKNKKESSEKTQKKCFAKEKFTKCKIKAQQPF